MGTEDKVMETDLAGIQKVLLEMIKTLADVCEKNGLRYCLYCGTLLGAIRHRGFIPWDNDADIVMPLTDYRRLLRIAERELPEGYVLQYPGHGAGHINPWAKLYKTGTTMLLRSQAAFDKNWGIYIDIYPMIGGPSAPWLRKAQQFLLKAAKGLMAIDLFQKTGNYDLASEWLQATGNSEKYLLAVRLLQVIPGPVRRAAARLLLRLTMLPTEKSSRIGSIDSADFCLKFERAWWKQTTTAVFEDGEFAVPAEYDRILTTIYGDYMTPPPKDQQVSHGSGKGDVIYDVHRDYSEYRKELLGPLYKQKRG